MITVEEARGKYEYKPETGTIHHKKDWLPSTHIGDEVGKSLKNGMYYVKIKDRKYVRSRLCWLIYYGEWPKYNIVHANGNILDDRIDNLVDVENVQAFRKSQGLIQYVPEFVWTKENLQAKFRYENGELFRISTGTKLSASKTNDGYLYYAIENIRKPASHIIWYYFNGEFPPKGLEIDHINHIRDDNRIENLRLLTRRQNCANQRVKTHLTGAYKRKNSWTAYLSVSRAGAKQRIKIGTGYTTELEAHQAYLQYIEDHPELK